MSNQTKHTPAPWQFNDSFRVYGPERRHPQSTEIGVEMTTHTTVAYVACPNYTEQEANARLIAAAPELLEALNKAIAYAANPQAFDIEGLLSDWRVLKAKAEGRP